eukprot:scaffold2.g7262.t1
MEEDQLDLQPWCSSLAEAEFECSPAVMLGNTQAAFKEARAGQARGYGVGRVRAGTQPAAAPVASQQHAGRLDDSDALRVGGLDALPNALEAEFWLHKAAAEREAGNVTGAAAVLQEALQRDVRPATAIVHALQEMQRAGGAEQLPQPAEAAQGAEAAAPEPAPLTARKTFTPSRTGLTGRAQRVAGTSRFAKTPGGALPAGQGAAAGAATAGTSKQTVALKKKLSFTVTKLRQQQGEDEAAVLATAGPASRIPAADPAATTTKHLRFGATPAAATAGRQGAGPRHVTFDASTVSPAARGRPPAVAPAAAPYQTPEPPILEEGSASSLEEGGCTTNTTNAGRTPFDRHMSSLFRKYAADATPEALDDDLLESLEDVARSPSWNRLSTVSVPDSIKVLSHKYSEEEAALASTPIVSMTAAAAAAALVPPHTAPSTNSPATVAATPHEQLLSVLKRNTAYESPASAGQAGAVPAAAAMATAATAPACAGTPTPVVARESSQPQLTPNTAIARLLGPVLRATIEEIEGSKAAAQQQQQQQQQQEGAAVEDQQTEEEPRVATAAAPAGGTPLLLHSSVSPTSGAVHLTPAFPMLRGGPAPAPSPMVPSPLAEDDSADINLSRADFGRMSLGPASTPDISLGAPDGVPRDSDGIPRVTPATVTVRRRTLSTSASPFVPAADDGLPANLLGSFASPTEEELQAQERRARGQAQGQDAAAAETPAPAPDDFSFFPAAPVGQAAPTPLAQDDGSTDTPDLQPRASGGEGEGAAAEGGGAAPDTGAGPGISPEILGFYEAQAAVAALPKSIIKGGRLRNEDGTPVLGRAQRVAPGTPSDATGTGGPPHTITKELQSLMAGLSLEDREGLERRGTLPTLSPVRAAGLGHKAVTPVRRSARNRAPPKPLEAMLEETDYSYVPNAAMFNEGAPPKGEGGKGKAAKKAAGHAGAAAEGSSSGSNGPGQENGGEPEASTAVPQATPAAPASQRRYSTRSAAAAVAVTPGTAGSPAAAAAVAALVVEQDSSPALCESPTAFAAQATGEGTTPHTYNLRRKSVAAATPGAATPGTAAARTPLGAANSDAGARTGQARGCKAGSASAVKLSPTEGAIRASLRRSARKSAGGSRLGAE